MDKLSEELVKQSGELSVEHLDAALEEQSARACPVKHTVELENKELWQEFHQYTNEMIITKAGRCMGSINHLGFFLKFSPLYKLKLHTKLLKILLWLMMLFCTLCLYCRRMFPLIQLSLSKLEPQAIYHLLLVLRVTDTRRWRFLNGEWTGSDPIVRGVASETTPTCSCIYVHPHSASTGEEWMKLNPVSFSKLKLSNKDTDGGKVRNSSVLSV